MGIYCTQWVGILSNAYHVLDRVHTVDHSMLTTTLYTKCDC